MTLNDSLCVVGIGCRFPNNANDPKLFWKNLLNQKDCITTVPEERWRRHIYTDNDRNKTGKIISDKIGFIPDIDKFDAEFFNISPAQAEKLDPQQRLLLEVTYETIEDAGIRLDDIRGTRTSVIIGSFWSDYQHMQISAEMRDCIASHDLMGVHLSTIANRISYVYNLKGPSITVDTACSSSMTAINAAIQSMIANECEMAFAGGVNLVIRPETSMALSISGFLSKDGQCKTFDESANGYVRSDGVGLVLIKWLSKALIDGNRIYAIIKNCGANHNGFNNEGLTVPSKEAQVDLIKRVYKQVSFEAKNLTYIEAHGTGTVVGDRIEAAALCEIFNNDHHNDKVYYVGSVKTNLGHSEGASGIASLIKALLITKYRKIPPNLHLNTINPNLRFQENRIEVPMQTIDLNDCEETIHVAVNSFGAGGMNVHILLEEYSDRQMKIINRDSDIDYNKENLLPFIITAKSKKSLDKLAERYFEYVNSTSEESILDICYALLLKRTFFSHQLIIIAKSKEELLQSLLNYIGKNENITSSIPANNILYRSVINDNNLPISNGKVAFVFSGQGGQWHGMGKSLMQSFPIFKEIMMEIDETLIPLSDGSSVISALESEEKLDEIMTLVCIMAIQIGLVKLWNCYGIYANGVIGHSIGEVAAECISGAITLKQAVYIIWHRSRILNTLNGRGKMLAIGVGEEQCKQIAAKYEVCIAAYNSPNLSVLSGNQSILEEVSKEMENLKIFNRFVKSNVPNHSIYMEEIKNDVLVCLKDIIGKQVQIPLYSTVTGKQETGEHLSAEYRYKNMRQTVLFSETIELMIADGYTHFIEIGPHPVLTFGIKELLSKHKINGEVYHSTLRNRAENIEFMFNVGKYIANKQLFDVHSLFYERTGYCNIELPLYVWNHAKSYWCESNRAMSKRIGQYVHPFLERKISIASELNKIIWETSGVSKLKYPYLADHVIDGSSVFPASAYVEYVTAVLNEEKKKRKKDNIDISVKEKIILKNVSFEKVLIVPENYKQSLQLRFEADVHTGNFAIYTTDETDDDKVIWKRHVTGTYIRTQMNIINDDDINLFEVQQIFTSANMMDVESFYDKLKSYGLCYGKEFRAIKQLWHKEDEILSKISLSNDIDYEMPFYYIHPITLDASWHTIYAETVRNGNENIYLPYKIDQLIISKQIRNNNVWTYIKIDEHSEEFLKCNVFMFDEEGEIVVKINGYSFKNLFTQRNPNEYTYEYEWIPQIHNVDEMTNYDVQECIIFSGDGMAKMVERLSNIAKRVNNVQVREYQIGCNDTIMNVLSNVKLDRRTHILFLPANKYKITSLLNYFETIQNETLYFLEMVQTIIKLNGTPRIYLICDNAINVETKLGGELNHSGLIGICRVLKNEHPEISLKMIHLAGMLKSTPSEMSEYDISAVKIYDEILRWNHEIQEIEIKISHDERHVRQLIPVKSATVNAKFYLNPSKSYMITGGMSGLGLKLAKWMIDNKAEHIVLISRNGFKTRKDKIFLDKLILSKKGIRIYCELLDITDIKAVENLFQKFGKSIPSLAGIIHSAAIREDITIKNMSIEQMCSVFNTKMKGALIMHSLTVNIQLDFFLLLSSISATIGTYGTANYAAANYSLDALAQLRHDLDLPVTSINLGVLGEYAGLSKMEETNKSDINNNNVDLIYMLERTGLLVMPLFEVLNNIEKAVVENRVNQLIAKINWKAVADTYPQFKLDARFTHIIKESKAITNRNTKEDKYNDIMKILSVENIEDHANVKLSILHILKQIFSIVLAIPIDELNDLQSIATYGLDSIVLNQIHTKILQKLNVNYPLMRLFKGPTLVELSEDIFEEIVTNMDNIREENKQIIDVKQSSYKYGYLIINKWLVTFKRNENAKFRMFCFPSMGANATLFAQYLQSPPDNVEIFAIQMPGREHRVEDEKIDNFSALIEEMAKYILPFIIDKPFIFWGHSFGGLIAFQLLTYLNNNNGNNLKALHFIVTGTIPPNLVKVWKTRDMVNIKVDKEAVDAIVAIFPFTSDSTFLKEILTLIDSDMPLLHTYYDYGMRKLNCSITVFAGTEDQVIYSNEIDQWQLFTEKNFQRFDVKGDHWFLTRNYLFIQDKYKQLTATDFQ